MTRAWLAIAIAGSAGCGRIGFAAHAGRADAPAPVPADAPPPDGAMPDASLDVGLLHRWPCDEVAGQPVAADVVGGAGATLTGGASFSPGHAGNALWTGSGGYAVGAATPADLLGAPQLTIAAWLHRDAPNDKVQVGQEGSVGVDELSIQEWDDGLLYFCIGTVCGTTPAGNDAGWHHVALVFDGTQPTDDTRLVGYLDGARQTLSWVYSPPVPATTPATAAHFDLDAVSDNEGQDTGAVDEVRIYGRALRPGEVAVLVSGT